MTVSDLTKESLYQSYSRKIYRFAYGKTSHEHNAQDLTQEILMGLYQSLRSGKQVDNMDAWVYTICWYTWSNYLAKEKRHWRNIDLEQLPFLQNAHTVDFDSNGMELMESLQQEVAYLSRLQREITIHYYYERQSVDQIAEQLGIAAGTVKWHLFEVRRKIKEAIKVDYSENTLSYKPVKLNVGHSGTAGPNNEPNGYFGSLLTSNICVAMYGKPLTIEEIARNWICQCLCGG